MAEFAAERRILGHAEGWRVEKRPGETCKEALWVLESGLLAPLSTVSAGHDHTLVRATAAVDVAAAAGAAAVAAAVAADAEGRKTEGRVFAFGSNTGEQLGLGESDEAVFCGWNEKEYGPEGDFVSHVCEASPCEVLRLRDQRVVSVSAGWQHSVALTQGGRVLTWGCSTVMRGTIHERNCGLLGHGPVPATFHMVAAPRPVLGFPRGTRVALVVAADRHTVCVTAMGEVFSWGDGGEGLGHGDEEDQHAPRRVEALAGQRVVDVDCDMQISVAVTSAGGLFAWGPRAEIVTPGPEGFKLSRGCSIPKQIALPSGERIRRASCSGARGFHIGAVDTRVLYTWGVGEYNRLGHGRETNQFLPRPVAALAGQRVATVSCGSLSTAALTEEGQLWTWGYDSYGKLGHHLPTQPKAYAEACAACPRNALEDDDAYQDRLSDVYLSLKVPEFHGEFPMRVTEMRAADGEEEEEEAVREVSCGSSHTVMVTASGKVCTFGSGDHGRLGHGHVDEDGEEVQIDDADPRASYTKLEMPLPCMKRETACVQDN